MKAKELIEIYTSVIEDAAEQGAESVPLSELQRVHAEIVKIVAESPTDVAVGQAAIEQYKAQFASNLEHHRSLHEINMEMLRATLNTGQSALRSSLLINGGAAVAILAFLGHAWSGGIPRDVILQASYGLSLFVWGVLAAAAATGATYLSQAGYGDELGGASQLIGVIGRGLAIALVIASYALFACGAWQFYTAISS